jgi:Tfp pilus assembly protein PilN
MANQLQLDFQRGPARLHWAGALLLLVGLSCIAIVLSNHFDLSAQLDAFDHRIDAAERTLRRQAPTPRASGDPLVRAEQSKEANEVLGLLSLPWQDALSQLEDVGRDDIALLNVEPDMQKGIIRLGGEAKTYEAILAYMKMLQARPGLSEVLLQAHQREAQKPGQPTRFLITAHWKSAS